MHIGETYYIYGFERSKGSDWREYNETIGAYLELYKWAYKEQPKGKK